MTFRPTIIVLAVERGRRFRGDRHKTEQGAGTGSGVLAGTLKNVLASGLPCRVVASAGMQAQAYLHVPAHDVIVLPEVDGGSRLGTGYAIASGVCASSDATGWLVLPGDMPLVQPQTLLAVAQALEQHPVAYAQYRGRRGHPVAFAAELYSELATLSGNEGARRLTARYPAWGVEVDDPGVLVDIDTLDDVSAVRARQAAVRAAAPPL